MPSSAPSLSQASRTDVETRANREVANELGEEAPQSEVVDKLLAEEASVDKEEPCSVVVEELVVDKDEVVEDLPNEDQDSDEIIPSSSAAPARNT